MYIISGILSYFIQFVHIAMFMNLHGPVRICTLVASASPIHCRALRNSSHQYYTNHIINSQAIIYVVLQFVN